MTERSVSSIPSSCVPGPRRHLETEGLDTALAPKEAAVKLGGQACISL